MKTLALILASVFLLSVHPSAGQSANLDRDRIPLVQLNGPWRFHTGDSPGWAASGFDDSKWSLLSPEMGWSSQGYAGYTGFGWYRLRVDLPAQHEPLAVYIPFVSNSYEVYANGVLIGRAGKMPPERKVAMAPRMVFAIPDSVTASGQPLELAIRVWHWSHFDFAKSGGMLVAPVIGHARAIQRLRELDTHETFWMQTDTELNLACNLLTALAALGLFVLRRKEREYLWFGFAQMLWGGLALTYLLISFAGMDYMIAGILLACAQAGAQMLNLEFFVTLMRQPKRVIYWTAAVAALAPALLVLLAEAGMVPDAAPFIGSGVLSLVYAVSVPALLIRGAVAGSREARLLLAPFTISFALNVASTLGSIPGLAGRAWVQSLLAHLHELVHKPFPMSAFNLAGDLAMFSVIAVLVYRYALSRRDEERLEAELQAARAVQHVLIPDQIPAVPGYRLECVYKPAGEVGGDFFQIIPLPEGEALIAIGDVSGKGMPAAMTVSMLVGMVRSLAHTTRSPAAILTALNQDMIDRTFGGFTTCLMLHIAADGVITAANAGHIAPYLAGHEVPVYNGLPLGLMHSTQYTESAFQLSPDDHLTLLTDGVLEARKADGELFGFERTASMSTHPAAEIARAAEQFGQRDDITVLSLTRQPTTDMAQRLAGAGMWTAVPA